MSEVLQAAPRGRQDAPRQLILASASPRRQALLRQAGWQFTVLPADIDERTRRGEFARDYVLRLAQAKAEAVAAHLGTAEKRPILAADTTVECGGRLLGKPATALQARRMLRLLSGRQHRVWTGVALLDPRLARGWLTAVVTRVWMRRLTPQQLADYAASGEPLDKAGGYAIQGGAAAFISRLQGEVDNVVGLPLAGLLRLWRARQRALVAAAKTPPRTTRSATRWIPL